jgi:hypothetical protein
LLLTQCIFSDESSGDASLQEHLKDEYYDYETTDGITIYDEREKTEDKIIEILSKEQEKRKEFIEEELLIKSGFKRTANVKFRKTTGKEKALSVLHGLFSIVSAGVVPVKPFMEVEYDRLPDGEYYNFYTVLFNSNLKNISLEIQKIMELEYKLQIEFANGTLIENWNVKYYTEENIEKFERLILSLPDTMDDIRSIKERFLNIELPKVETALYRYLNPSELYIQARKNLSDMFKHND